MRAVSVYMVEQLMFVWVCRFVDDSLFVSVSEASKQLS